MRRYLVCVLGMTALACTPRTPPPPQAELSAVASLGGGGTGYARALEVRPFTFPADHGPHPDFRTEWWYFTGNLESGDGRRFGYQLTFFRRAVAPQPPPILSRWATRQLYLAHFALTDVAGGKHAAWEEAERGALGLAGAAASPFRVWVGAWEAEGGDGTFPIALRAEAGWAGLDLQVERGKPVALQGNRGLSRKGRGEGSASYYYSLTRLPTTGVVTVSGDSFRVTGSSWLDREWSTSLLEEGAVGWDWLGLQLADGRDLMFFRVRFADPAMPPFTDGTLVDAAGGSRRLQPGEVELEETGWWGSPESGVRYPVRWRLAVPAEGLGLEVVPVLSDQEVRLGFRYWEGAVTVRDTSAEGEPAGAGYVELVGYGEDGGPPAPR